MSERIERVTESFIATSEEDEQFTINVFQTFIISVSRAGREELPGMKRLETSDGQSVNYVDENTFEVLGGFNDIIVKRAHD